MIDFRYHLVSIVAVFLALAIGIVVGSTALQGKVVNALNRASQDEQKTNDTLRANNSLLKQQISADGLFAQANSSYLLSHLLQGEQVVLVTAPGADGPTIAGITSAMQQAGATVTGQVSLTPQFFDISAGNEIKLSALAQHVAPAGIGRGPQALSAQISGQQTAAQIIAAAIVHKDGTVTVSSAQSQQILNGFGEQGFLQVSGASGSATLAGQATLAVVVIPTTPPANASDPQNLALVAVADELQRASAGALLAGSLPGSGTASAIDAVTSGAAGVVVTTVDDANTASGQIIVVQALRQLLDPDAVPTAYGVGPASVPSPVPSVAPTTPPSPTATRSVLKHPVKS